MKSSKFTYEIENLTVHKKFSEKTIEKMEEELLKFKIGKNTAELKAREFESKLFLEQQKTAQLWEDLQSAAKNVRYEESSLVVLDEANSPKATLSKEGGKTMLEYVDTHVRETKNPYTGH